MLYASLTGPLLGLYTPLPTDDKDTARLMIGSSSLQNLWCSIYTSEQVDEFVTIYGGGKLPDIYASRLDYDWDLILDQSKVIDVITPLLEVGP